MVQVDYNHDKQFLEVNSKYMCRSNSKKNPFLDNPGLQLVQDVFQRQNFLKFIYSEKATKFCEISTLLVLCSAIGGDFAKFCGLFRIYEL